MQLAGFMTARSVADVRLPWQTYECIENMISVGTWAELAACPWPSPIPSSHSITHIALWTLGHAEHVSASTTNHHNTALPPLETDL